LYEVEIIDLDELNLSGPHTCGNLISLQSDNLDAIFQRKRLMSRTNDARKDEFLAQLGIKKGSILLPVITVALIFFGVYVVFAPTNNQAADIFDRVCHDVVLDPMSAKNSELEQIKTQCGEASSSPFEGMTFEKRIRLLTEIGNSDVDGFSNDEIDRLPSAFFHLFKGYLAHEFAAELLRTSGKFFAAQFDIFWKVGLIAVLAGLLGMIYRRAFWWYFFIVFVPLLMAREVFWYSSQPKTLISIFQIFVLQFIILLLAMRLQRFSANTGKRRLSARWYNMLLVLVLTAVGIAWFAAASGGVRVPILHLQATMFSLYQWAFIIFGLPIIYGLLRRSDLWDGQTPKNIIVCLDGTTNTPDQYEFGRLAQTNVFKLFKMLKSTQAEKRRTREALNATFSKRYDEKQIALYFSGVGNRFDNNPIIQVLGGATGLGAASVVSQAYLDVMRIYRPGDRIFLFGFSRGAAIARLLARAIDQRGVPKTVWTLRVLGRHWTIKTSGLAAKVPITVLGCWDTVGAFGIGKNIAGIEFQKMDLFKDLTVPDNVEQAYHMVAMDEMREEFQPTLMEPNPVAPGRIVEVWFSGDHANIGGGWATTKLSDQTLDFLLKHTSSGYATDETMAPGEEGWGMYLSAANASTKSLTEAERKDTFEVEPDALGQLRRWDSAMYNYTERKLPNHAVISESVFERMQKARPLYAPKSLFEHHRALNKTREEVGQEINSLSDTKSLSAAERDKILSIRDNLRITRWPRNAEDVSYEKEADRLKNPIPARAIQ
jgi:hypothetical protein